jgi:EAL domain-containing protein (putative c-di-GMP-specific phosphodiesterase class I)/DNA-binding response OmpR family regulator
VLRTACRQARAWQAEGFTDLAVAVNLSGRQLQDPDLYDTVAAALADSGLEPRLLELELTESFLVLDPEEAVRTLGRLKQLGVKISVDDFGTGYSSLAYLKRFPLDTLKVDRAFVRDIMADPNDASITRAIINLAHNLKLTVVAEGVETEAQLGLLIANNCDLVQGYYFSRPVPEEAFIAMLREGKSLASQLIASQGARRTLLLVDDEEFILSSLKRILRRSNCRVLTADSALKGLQLLAENRVDVVISDQRMPGMAGVEFLRRVKDIHPDSVRMMLSGYTDLKSVTDAINEGAIYKFLTKPWDDDHLLANIEEAFRRKEMISENQRLGQELALTNARLGQVNDELRGLLDDNGRQARRDETVLGVMQEGRAAARPLHRRMPPRRVRRLVPGGRHQRLRMRGGRPRLPRQPARHGRPVGLARRAAGIRSRRRSRGGGGMNLIPIEHAKADMVLADDLCRTDCQPLLASGTRLTDTLLDTLRERGITSLSVRAEESVYVMDKEARRQQVLERLSYLFRGNAGNITGQALFRAVYEYRMGAL